jgi:muramoyltetrapeptide carboxypeptidase
MIIPPLLQHGDKIAIVAPAGKLERNSLDKAVSTLSSWGLDVHLGKSVYKGHNYFSGTDAERLFDLQEAFDDPSIKVILTGRGGYGVTRILQKINFERIINKPKWVIGFSDITALHLQLQQHNIASIHGPMAASFTNSSGKNSIEAMKKILFNGGSEITSTGECIRPGQVIAEITGGNLSLIVDSLGTINEIDTHNKLLFLEEVGEKTYRIDRMLHQLYRAGKLDQITGLVIGHFTEIDEGRTPFGDSWKECIMNLTREYDYPVSFGWNIGHEPANFPIVMGGNYKLEATVAESSLIFLLEN